MQCSYLLPDLQCKSQWSVCRKSHPHRTNHTHLSLSQSATRRRSRRADQQQMLTLKYKGKWSKSFLLYENDLYQTFPLQTSSYWARRKLAISLAPCPISKLRSTAHDEGFSLGLAHVSALLITWLQQEHFKTKFTGCVTFVFLTLWETHCRDPGVEGGLVWMKV